MKFLPKNTLAHYNAAPQVHQHNLSVLPTAVLAEATRKFRESCGSVSPSNEALTFYTLNHAASIVRKLFTANEPMPEWAEAIMKAYTDLVVTQGERMLHYILSISIREMRHLKSKTDAPLWKKLEAEHGVPVANFIKDVTHHNENGAVDAYMTAPPNASIEAYTRGMALAYYKGQWPSSYGGPAWGGIVDAVVSYLTGVTSMEMLVDTGYTLAHNTAPIFNKGMMYGSQDSHLLTILDVQRSGQMLDLMFASDALGVYKTPEAIAVATVIKTHCPMDANGKPTLKGYVDWKQVEALRPSKDKNSQPSKYAKVMAAQTQATAKAAHAKPAKPAVKKVNGKVVKVTGEWQVFPHQVVTVYERVGS